MVLANMAASAHTEAVDRRIDDLAAPLTVGRRQRLVPENLCLFDGRSAALATVMAVGRPCISTN